MKYCLIVDDSQSDSYLIEKFLLRMGFFTIVINNPFKVIDILKKGNVDIVTVDIKMPEMNGFELIKHIRKVDKSIPIVIISGSNIENLDVNKHKANHFISKPFTEHDFKNVFTQYLSN